MGEHETVAALSQQVAELRDAFEDVRAKVTRWDARLQREGIGGTLMLRLEIKKLREQVVTLSAGLANALASGKLKIPVAPRWDDLDPASETAQIDALQAWVDEFLAVQYPGYRLASCWAAHREALWELGTLYAEWQRINNDPAGTDLAGALWFHERWLPGALSRLGRSITCDEGGCRLGRPDRRR